MDRLREAGEQGSDLSRGGATPVQLWVPLVLAGTSHGSVLGY